MRNIDVATASVAKAWANVIPSSYEPYKVTIDPKLVQKVVEDNWDEIQESVKIGLERKEQSELMAKQRFNKEMRGLVKHVHWSGNTCIVYWNDGTQTKSHWDNHEPFDAEKAILVCMARKLYQDSNIYNEVLEKYADDGRKHYEWNYLNRMNSTC